MPSTASTPAIELFSPSQIADDLGQVRAEIKALQDRQKRLEEALKARKVVEASGVLYRVKIAYGIQTTRVNWKAIAERFKPSHQLISAHSKVTQSDRITVTAHHKAP